jgi:serine/threonine protein kinase
VNAKDPFRPSHHGVSPGTRLNGIYEIDLMIGSGGMGEIYKGHEIQTGSAVAIKMLLPEMAENEAALALFRREASALHYLMHDAIVRYFVFTVEPTLQRPYLAMEFVDGRSLSDVLEEGPLTFEALVRLMRRVASGLQAAHLRGIVHRDVSPDNIIIPQGDVGRAKIIDFGIARSTQLGDSTIIGTGFAGKHNYVSPEQIGLFGGDVTAKSDVYSLGLVLFYALTGQKLDMGGSQFQLVEKRRKLPDLGGVDLRIRPLLEQMLQPDPAKRSSMADLENWSVGSSGAFQTNQNIKAETLEKSAGTRGRLWYVVISAAIIVLIAASAAIYYKLVWNATIIHAPPALPRLDQNPDAVPPPPPLAPPSQPATKKPPLSEQKMPVDTPNRADIARRFIEQYDGGECFYVTPIAISSSAAVLEGLGASTAPFELLDKSFSKTQGFEASIGVRLATQAQCPAVNFLNHLRADASRAPRITLDAYKLKNGETLNGTIDNFANRIVELLLVTDTGQVQNLSYLMKPGTDAVSFAIKMQRADEATGQTMPQLIMAVASPRVLDSLRQLRPSSADQFFLQALSESQRLNLSVEASFRYVQLER